MPHQLLQHSSVTEVRDVLQRVDCYAVGAPIVALESFVPWGVTPENEFGLPLKLACSNVDIVAVHEVPRMRLPAWEAACHCHFNALPLDPSYFVQVNRQQFRAVAASPMGKGLPKIGPMILGEILDFGHSKLHCSKEFPAVSPNHSGCGWFSSTSAIRCRSSLRCPAFLKVPRPGCISRAAEHFVSGSQGSHVFV